MLTRNSLCLLLWILFDGGLLTPLQPQPQQTLATQPTENVIHLPGRQPHFQRVKRGWVWNQFFVLEEYMGSEPQYVGKVMLSFLIVYCAWMLCSDQTMVIEIQQAWSLFLTVALVSLAISLSLSLLLFSNSPMGLLR